MNNKHNINEANKAKSITISGYYGFENFGDEAILRVLTEELKKYEYKITVFSKSPQTTSKKLTVNSINTFDIKNVINQLKNTDTLISGGGSLLQDTTSIKSLLYYLFVIRTAQFFKKDVIIFAQGIGPIKNCFGRFITKQLLKKCKYVTVRDKKSLELLNNWGIEADLVSDPVWNIELPKHSPQKRIGIQLREWQNVKDNYLEKLASNIIKDYADYKIEIYSFQDAIDIEISTKFEKILKEQNPNIKTQIIKACSIEETIQKFSNLDKLIAMRYHACLLALKFGIPTLAINYDPKVKKLAQRFAIPYSNIDEIENMSNLFNTLTKLEPTVILETSKTCYFDFTKIIKSLNE